MTDEIRGQLVRVSALRVVSRSAAQRYGDDDIPRLRSELGAGSALEGSVRLDGQRVRVAVELVDTTTEQTIWSEQYDRTVDDVLSVQSEVAMRIAAALDATLTAAEQTQVARPPTANPKAYEVYLRAQGFSSGERQQNLRSIELYREALKLDPSFRWRRGNWHIASSSSRITTIPSISIWRLRRPCAPSRWIQVCPPATLPWPVPTGTKVGPRSLVPRF